MDILFYFIYLFFLIIRFLLGFFCGFFVLFSSSYTGYGPLQFKVIIYLPAVTSSFS